MNRRGFLQALAATALAPFIPAIAAAPQLDELPFDDIVSGRTGIVARLAGPNGIIESFKPQPVTFDGTVSDAVSFGTATECCTVTHLVLDGIAGLPQIKISLDLCGGYSIMPGDTLTICSGIEMSCA